MKIDEKKLRRMIQLEAKTMLAEAYIDDEGTPTVAQGLKNVVGQAKSQIENQMFELSMDSDAVWNAFELAKKAVIIIVAEYTGAPPSQVKSFLESSVFDEEMDVHVDIVNAVTKFAAIVAQEYMDVE